MFNTTKPERTAMQYYENIMLQGMFAPIILEELQIHQAYNHHATIRITGRIPAGLEGNYLHATVEGAEINIDIKGEEAMTPLFYGMLESIAIHQYQDVYSISITGISKTKLLDIKKEHRSFQDIKQTYDDVIQERMDGIDGQYINEDKKKDEPIEKFTLQYNETRWEFIKRLVSRHNEGLLPDITTSSMNYWIGMPNGRSAKTVEKTPFESIRKPRVIKTHIDNKKITDADEQSFFCYRLLHRLDAFLLGDMVQFENLSWRIIEIDSYLDAKEAVLRHNYLCIVEEGCKQPLLHNTQIRGLSLEGITIDRRKDFSKVHLYTIDEEQPIDTASWFRYCTYYTAGSDQGWCAMPELNDELSLHFPTIEENDCFLLDSTQVPYDQSIYSNINMLSKAGRKPYTPTAGKDKTQRTIVDSKFVIAPKGQTLLMEDTDGKGDPPGLIHLASANNASTLKLITDHPEEETGTTLGIKLLTNKDMKLDNGGENVKNLRFGVPNTPNSVAPSQELFFFSEKSVILKCEGTCILLNHETGMTDYYAMYIDLLPPE